MCVIRSTPTGDETDWHRGAAESLMWHIMMPGRCHPPPPPLRLTRSDWSELLFPPSQHGTEHGSSRAGRRAKTSRLEVLPPEESHKIHFSWKWHQMRYSVKSNPTLENKCLPKFCSVCKWWSLCRLLQGTLLSIIPAVTVDFSSSEKIAWGGYSRSIHLNRPLNSLAECLLICGAAGSGPRVLASHKPSGFRKERLQVQSEGWAAARLRYCHRFNQDTPYIQSPSLWISRVWWIEQRIIFQ